MRDVEGSTRLIGLSGRKGSGKDTVGAYLRDRYGFETVSFAGPLKVAAAAVFDVDPQNWEQWKNDETALITLEVNGFIKSQITARQYLQRFGTEAHRDVFGKDFWLEACFNSLNPLNDYAITDVRFPDEHDAVRDRGGVVIRIERGSSDVTDTHASETLPGYDHVDWIIRNDGSYEDLYAEVDRVMRAEGR